MAGYMVCWPKDHIQKLKKEEDNGPISVVFGSIHSKIPTISSVKESDVVFPVMLNSIIFCAMARLPVQKVAASYGYLVRELGNPCGALVHDGRGRSRALAFPPLNSACSEGSVP